MLIQKKEAKRNFGNRIIKSRGLKNFSRVSYKFHIDLHFMFTSCGPVNVSQ